MKSFPYANMPLSAYSNQCFALLSEIHEYKGRFDALKPSHQALLERLERVALLDNVDASNRIDGIYVSSSRVQELIDGDEPLSERERQTSAYTRTCKAFQKEPDNFPIDASTFLAMHTVLMGGAPSGKKSSYRTKDYVNMMVDGAVKQVPASPILAFETPLYLGSACDNLAQAFSDTPSRQLLLIPTFAVDVMCIKPFDEGTGRLVRLFSLLLMEKAEFDICRYVSVDRLCAENAAAYYEALNKCLGSWDSLRCDYSPFVTVWLTMVKRCYEKLFQVMGEVGVDAGTKRSGSKTKQVKDLFAIRFTPLTKQQVCDALPDVSQSTVENALRALVQEGYLEKHGGGRSTSYSVANR